MQWVQHFNGYEFECLSCKSFFRKSMWKLVYFMKEKSNVVDSRVTENLRGTSLPEVRGPLGVYRHSTVTDNSEYLSYTWSGAFIVSAKFGKKEKSQLREIIKQAVQRNLTGTLHVYRFYLLDEIFTIKVLIFAREKFLWKCWQDLSLGGNIHDDNPLP